MSVNSIFEILLQTFSGPLYIKKVILRLYELNCQIFTIPFNAHYLSLKAFQFHKKQKPNFPFSSKISFF